ncbi:hypothetical protein ACOSQ3_005594 [Xanthoceras sorbifolium]
MNNSASLNFSESQRNCYKCGRGIAEKEYFYCKDKHWHLSCLSCDCCHRSIHKSKFFMVEDDIYHESCYNSKHTNWRKCSVCLKIKKEEQQHIKLVMINIPIYLVDIDDITNLATLRPTGQPILSDISISRVIRHRPDLYVDTVGSCKLSGSEMIVKKKTKELSPLWILIPYGLPCFSSSSFFTKNYKDFKPSIKEGICKAMGYKTLGDQKTDPIGNAQKVEFVKMYERISQDKI